MKVFLLAVLILALCVTGMALSIMFRKNGKFPDSEISHNKTLREQGIICAKEEELRLWKKRGKNAAAKGPRPDKCRETACDGCTSRQETTS